MKLEIYIVITFITAFILASCSSATINYSNELPLINKALKAVDIDKYFRYQDFSASSLEDLERYISNKKLKTNETREAINLRDNIRKILSKKEFTLDLSTSNIYTFELIELIYSSNLPIAIQWNQSDEKDIFQHSVTEKISGFCSSIYEDSQVAISKKINILKDLTLIIYMPRYENIQRVLSEQFPKSQNIKFNNEDEQKFASKVLEIDQSNQRFNKILNLNPNQKLHFYPRSREDVRNIVLLLEPNEYQSVLPAFKYHGGEQFKYINFISSLENLDNVNQLLDFENSFIPLPFHLSKKIQNKEIFFLGDLMELSILNDWLILEILKQSSIRYARVSGMTGELEYQRGSCTKRSIPMQMINSSWVTS